jgi:hypothetical protein
MKSLWARIIPAFVCLLLFAFMFMLLMSQAPRNAAPAKWEYATLFMIVDVGQNTTLSLRFESKKTNVVEATSGGDLSKKLGGIGGQDCTITEILNDLGSQGWELTSHAMFSSTPQLQGQQLIKHFDKWTFKRRQSR